MKRTNDRPLTAGSITDVWMLTYVAQSRSKKPGAPLRMRALEQVSMDALRSDIADVKKYCRSFDLVRSVQFNVRDFAQAVVDSAAFFLEHKSLSNDQLGDVVFEFSNRLLNILNAFRCLLDHSNTAIARQFGKESSQWSRWKDTVAAQYDSSFEYRLFYALRNIAQHVGVPPLTVSFFASDSDEGIQLRLDIGRDQLLEHEINKKLVADLNDCSTQISLIDALDRWSDSFWTISDVVLEIWRSIALPAAQRIANHRTRLNLPKRNGYLCAAKFSTGGGTGLAMEVLDIEEKIARQLVANRHFKKRKRPARSRRT